MIQVKTPDFRKEIVNLGKIGEAKLKEVQFEIEDTADQIVLAAKNKVPVNEGLLKNEISRKQLSQFQYQIVAETNYSAFMEFGTKTLAQIPAGAGEVAAEVQKAYQQAKSNKQTGTIQQFEERIRRWVRLKGITGTYSVKTRRRTGGKAKQAKEDDQVVFFIMRKILKIGVKPQPFFYPSIAIGVKGLASRLTKIVTK